MATFPTSPILKSLGNSSSHPIKCYNNLGDYDPFSGWYATSDPSKCTDFCFWDLTSEDDYETFTPLDPHSATTSDVGAWRCALDVSGDDTMWSDVNSLTSDGHFGMEFKYLRCNRGADEVLSDVWSRGADSTLFWYFLILFSVTSCVLINLAFWWRWKKKRADYSYNVVKGGEEENPENDIKHNMQICKKVLKMSSSLILIVALNIGIVITLIISSTSLHEMNYPLSERAQSITPKCYDPNSICSAANVDIDRQRRINKNDTPLRENKPFSYLIASDAQLDWYNGETATMGTQNIPTPCGPRDSCGSCTYKFGRYTNHQIKKAIENLSSSSTTSTLVMNGDLTSYFHPGQIQQYESIFHNLKGIHNYFPSLGNHDYDHYAGARYGTDQWVGPSTCNAFHAIGYMKKAFCGMIPNFQPQKILRYDSKSLAYSWDEHNYHFVHLNFYPSFEAANINLSSSLKWLDRDISLAYNRNLTTILFVHAAQYLGREVNHILLNKNVKAIFAGHTHRCLGRKCVGLRPLKEYELARNNITDENDLKGWADKCVPATMSLCGGSANANWESLFYLKNRTEDFDLPDTELFYPEQEPNPHSMMCPQPKPVYINQTDNTLLCTKVTFSEPDFPFSRDANYTGESIPIFWSGSSSFQTFLKVDFYHDRFVTNVITALEGLEGQRYVDTHELPNAVYPGHNREDVEEVTIYL